MANWAYTNSFTLTTAEVIIKLGNSPGNGVIPSNIDVSAIELMPSPDGEGSYPDWQIKGMHEDSTWITKPGNDTPIEAADGLSGKTQYLYIRAASGSLTMNLKVRGSIG
jgi:hypothetical protein